MAINKPIVIGAVGITALGVVTAAMQHKPISRIVMGGYLVALIGSAVDLVGGDVSVLMGGIVMAAFFGVVLTEGGPILAQLGVAVPGANSGPSTPPGAPPPGKTIS
jgi:hypothetical protein